jgi:hypothetical protein
MANIEVITWNLKEIISELTKAFPTIKEVYLFGSRAYKTNSLRSDIDLLIFSENIIPANKIFDWITSNYNPIDIFKTIDKKNAESAINGSILFLRNGFTDLPTQLDAILLWKSDSNFSDTYEDWDQLTRKGVRHEATYAYMPYTITDAINDYDKYLSENDFPNTNLGNNWDQIGARILKKIDIGLSTVNKWTGDSGSFHSIKLSIERDFQNLIELILKPWLPDTQRETCAAKFDSQEKKIDFSIQLDRILIEAKHIKDANTEAKAIKEIEGITKFYLANTNVNLLIFVCLVEDGFPRDINLFESTFSKTSRNTIVITKCFKNILH